MLHFNKLPAHIHTFSDPWKLTVTLKKELPWTMVWVILLISSGHISLRTVEWEITKQLSTTPLNCPQKPNMALWQLLYTETCHVEMKKKKKKRAVYGEQGQPSGTECKTCDRKVVGSSCGRSGRRIFISRVNFLCWLMTLILVACSTPLWDSFTAVAHKR